MGRLLDGKWVARDLNTDEQGRFVRNAATFRESISSDGSSPFPAAAGRYVLYVSHACGWSHRALIFRELKGLSEIIPIVEANPFMGEQGWTFAPLADPVNGIQRLYQLYQRARPGYTGRVTVPVLWDKETESIVSNESLDVIRSFDAAFARWSKDDTCYFPSELGSQIDEMIQANYHALNNGVYRAGFAGNQEAYEEAVTDVFRRLDQLETLLAQRRYLLGDRVSAADWCLFPTLFRFDAVYHYHFKCNKKRLVDYPNLWNYTRELYQHGNVKRTCRIDTVKQHYYSSHESINPRRVIPIGPELDFEQPHTRG